ncbi:hypothetical protein [Endozoicomonas lisbonensis]|uniref:Uncharacterized protein n=1 Tax=Endozoicomonas lisbonensis TaxID=3120522 RepID=A0ABV2SKH2_9GAMM
MVGPAARGAFPAHNQVTENALQNRDSSSPVKAINAQPVEGLRTPANSAIFQPEAKGRGKISLIALADENLWASLEPNSRSGKN